MRPNVELTRDPLRPELMPPTDGMELDYRTQPCSARACRGDAVYAAVLLGVLGLLLTLALRGLGAYLSTFWFLFPAVLITGAIALYQFLQHEPPWQWGKWVVAGPLIWLLSNISAPAWQGLLLFVTLLAATFLSHRVIMHYAYWLHANPNLERGPRQAWDAVWNPLRAWRQPRRLAELWWPRESPAVPASEWETLQCGELSERHAYGRSFAVVGSLYVLAMLWFLVAPGSLMPGLWAYTIFLALLLAYGFWQLSSEPGAVTPLRSLRIVADALTSWLTYNRHATPAPGVFRSPCGPARLRRGEFFVIGLLVALTVLPLASYFPLGMPILGTQRWLAATQAPWPWEQVFQRDQPTSIERPPTPHQSLLSDAYLNQLTADQRATYEKASANLAAQVQAVRYLAASPEATLLVCVRGAVGGDATFVGSLILALLTSIGTTAATLFCLTFALGARPLAHFYVTLEQGADGGPARYHSADQTSLWEHYIRRLRSSPFETWAASGRRTRERDLLLVGFNAFADYPVLLERGILGEHAHIMGDSGSGKSSLGLAPLMAQLIGRPHTSVVVLDLKGDRALFEGARCAVRDANASRDKRRRVRFRWFTNKPNLSTFAFNPFLQRHMQRVTIQQKASILLKSLGLDYGEGFGESYYSSVHRSVLLKVLQDDPTIASFRQLQGYFHRDLRTRLQDLNIDRKVYQDASHLFSVIDSLASFDALNITPASQIDPAVLRHQIDLARVVTQPTVVYFYLHSALEEKTVSEVAKLALHSLLTAAVERGPSKHTVYLLIDEFQQVVSADLEIVLRQARSMGISVILANHTISDLRTKSADLIPTVQTNTRYKQVFAASDLQQQDMLIKASGETIYELWGGSSNSTGRETFNWHETISPRLMRNDIIGITDRELHSVIHVPRGLGVTQFGGFMFEAVCPYHITYDEYDRRSRAAWPQHQTGTLIARPDTSVADQHEIDRRIRDEQRVISELEQRIEEL